MVYSEAAELTVGTPLCIVTQPQDMEASVGSQIQIRVHAQGDGLTYRWQYQMAGQETWNNSGLTGFNSDTLVVPVTAGRSGQRYRCRITDQYGNDLYSEEATLIVKL